MSNYTFKETVEKRGVDIIDLNKSSNYSEAIYTLRDSIKGLQNISNVTRHFDYKCDFKNEICKKYYGLTNDYPDRSLKCCCSCCQYELGYHMYILSSDLNIYRKRWSKYTGYWRKGEGCILPRKYRSWTCVMFHCLGKNDPVINDLNVLGISVTYWRRKINQCLAELNQNNVNFRKEL